jgi:hypothetical protein
MTTAWRDVREGPRELDWHVALGGLDMVAEVTVLGRQVGARAAHDLETFFGTGWLARATAARGHTAIAGLAQYWPSLGSAGAYSNMIGLWASLQLLVDSRVRGIGGVRKSLRTNLQEAGFRHALTQVRLAAQGVVAGHDVTLEPSKRDGDPGDLGLERGGAKVFLEIKTFNPDRQLDETEERAGLRLWRDLDKKGRQTRVAGAAWVWVQDNSNTLWPRAPSAQMPLDAKIKAMHELVYPLLDMHPHLAGVVLTSACTPDGSASGVTNVDVQLPEGLGFRRLLPGGGIRESVVLHRWRPMVLGQLDLLVGLCAQEPSWLDLALSRLGIAGGLASLTTHCPSSTED